MRLKTLLAILVLVASLVTACGSRPAPSASSSPESRAKWTPEGRWLAFDLDGAGTAELHLAKGELTIETWELPDAAVRDSRTSLMTSPLKLSLEESTSQAHRYKGTYGDKKSRFHLMFHSPGEAEMSFPDGRFWLLRKTKAQLPESQRGLWVVFKGGKRIGKLELSNTRWTFSQPERKTSTADIIPLEGKSGFSLARKLIHGEGRQTPWRMVHYNPLPEGGFLGVTEERWEVVTLYRTDQIPSLLVQE